MALVFPDGELSRLIDEARTGRTESLNQICDGLRGALRDICQRRLPRQLGAKASESDLVQEALLGVTQNFASFQGRSESDLMGWVWGIVENKSLELQRRYLDAGKRDLLRELPLAANSSSYLGSVLKTGDDSPLDRLVSLEDAARVQRLLQELPLHYREVIELRHRSNLSFVEVAKYLGRTVPSVKNIYVRAIEILQRRMSE